MALCLELRIPCRPIATTPKAAKKMAMRVSCSRRSQNGDDESGLTSDEPKKRISEQSSWEAKDSEGRDYLYRLGQEADNMNIAVGARKGVVDDLFVGNFLGKDSDIVFDYRQKVTRSFQYLQGDYYIAPAFLDKVGKLCEPLLGFSKSRHFMSLPHCEELYCSSSQHQGSIDIGYMGW
ncbi:hypothetical protein J5N97_003456 [Dioscorea zingiberensis]|uniref:Uncharacterized protein n=1 Tax=Dioscorea zingiberensis TaxID=325984 RepID=A0A9D5D461_9LILI|nr:hypothetical protein J5N97_003456 [Dioscorea zingiberensis]